MTILNAVPPARSMPPDVAQRMRHELEFAVAAPEPSRPKSRVRWGAPTTGVAATVAVAAAILVIQPWASTSAYASWTAAPDQVDVATEQALGAACTQQQRAHFKDFSAVVPVVAERRGDFTAVLMGGGGSAAVCVSTTAGDLGGQTQLSPMPAAATVIMDDDPGLLSGPDAFRVAYGRVSADVAKVEVQTQDGLTVIASTAQGRFLSWWPSGAGPSTIIATDSSGRQVGRLSFPPSSTTAPAPTHR
jgi:hypothetical protein